MTDVVGDLSLRALAPEDRARLAQGLIASLEGDLKPELDAAWDEVPRKHVAEVERDIVNLAPANEVFE